MPIFLSNITNGDGDKANEENEVLTDIQNSSIASEGASATVCETTDAPAKSSLALASGAAHPQVLHDSLESNQRDSALVDWWLLL